MPLFIDENELSPKALLTVFQSSMSKINAIMHSSKDTSLHKKLMITQVCNKSKNCLIVLPRKEEKVQDNDWETCSLHEVHGNLCLEEAKEHCQEEQGGDDDRNDLAFDYDIETSVEMMLSCDVAQEEEDFEEEEEDYVMPRPDNNDFVVAALDSNDDEDDVGISGDADDVIFAPPQAFTSAPLILAPRDWQISVVTSCISTSLWPALP